MFKDHGITEPPRYIVHTPTLFNEWVKFADIEMNKKNRSSGNNALRSFGETNAPEWIKFSFSNLEEFYQYYNSLLVFKEE